MRARSGTVWYGSEWGGLTNSHGTTLYPRTYTAPFLTKSWPKKSVAHLEDAERGTGGHYEGLIQLPQAQLSPSGRFSAKAKVVIFKSPFRSSKVTTSSKVNLRPISHFRKIIGTGGSWKLKSQQEWRKNLRGLLVERSDDLHLSKHPGFVNFEISFYLSIRPPDKYPKNRRSLLLFVFFKFGVCLF